MTNKTRRTAIIIETHEVTIIRRGGRQMIAFCRFCQLDVRAFRPDEIEGLAISGKIHLIEILNGEPSLVCGRSLGEKNQI